MPYHAPGLFSHYEAQLNGLPSPLTPETQPEHNIYSALFSSSFDTHRFLSEAEFSPKPQPAAVQPPKQQQRKQYKPSPQMRFPQASNNKATQQRKKSSPPQSSCTKPSRFDALNVHPLFKSRLCRHYMTRGFCAYGEMCRFAHGRQDLRHKGESIEDYARRTGRDPVELFKALSKDAPQMQRQQDGTIRAVSKVGNKQTVVKAVTKPKAAAPKPAQRVTVAEVRRARRHSVDLERIYQRQQQEQKQQRQHKSCPTVPRRLNQHQLDLLQDELRQTSPQHQPTMSRASSVDSELDEIAEQLRQMDMAVIG